MILNINFKKLFFITFIIIGFHEIFIELKNIFNHLKLFTGNFYDNVHSYKLFRSQYLRCDDSLFLS